MPTSPSSSIARAARRRLRYVLVRAHRLDQLRADLEERVQRGERVLEDHRDLVAPDRAQLAIGQATRSLPSNRIRPDTRAPCVRVRPSVVSDETVLPEPDSPTIPSVLPARDLVGDPVDRMHDAVFRRELDVQVLDAQQRLLRAHE